MPHALRLGSIALSAVALVGCSTSTQPDPSPSVATAEPATLDELAAALVDEGAVLAASLTVHDASAADPETLVIRLQGLEESTPQQLTAVLGDVQDRIDAVLDDRPATTQIQLSTLLADGRYASLDMQRDLGRDVLLELLGIATETVCNDVATTTVDRFGTVDGRDGLTGVSTNVATLRCLVDADDAIALASSYDEVTSIAPTATLVGETRWRVEPLDPESGSATVGAAELIIDAGPIEGRQQALVDLMTIADDAGGEQLYVEDSGDRVDVGGFIAADRAPACDALMERLRSIPDLGIRTVAFDDAAVPDDYVDVCFLQE